MAKSKAPPRPRTSPAPTTPVAERRRAEEALRESEARWRSLVESAPDIIGSGAPDGTIWFINQGVRGIPPEELVGTSIYDLIDQEYRDTVRKGLEHTFRTGQKANAEFSWVKRDGTTCWCVARVGPIERDGQTVGLTVILSDITERKCAEEALRESEARLRSTLDGMLEGCQIIGFDWRYLYVNDAVARHGRKTKEELLGHTMMEVYPGIDDTELFGYLRRCMEERIPHRMENEFTYPDGVKAWFVLSIQPVTDGIFILSLDVTERKRAEEALRESEERFRLLAEHAQDVIFRCRLVEPVGYEYMSPAVAAVTGYPPEQFYADPDFTFKIVHPDDRETFERMLGERRTGPVVLRWICRDGSTIWVEQRNTFVYDESGNLVAIEGVARDITKRRRAEEALRQAREELEGRVERQMLHRNPYSLTFREFTVLHLVAAGRADKEIACELGISPLTVHKHVGNILGKMSASCRTEAGVRALREGLLD